MKRTAREGKIWAVALSAPLATAIAVATIPTIRLERDANG
jgi:hypothetical protein